MEINLFREEAPAQNTTELIESSTVSLKRSPEAGVGYGKPPAQYRFRPGQSGNPAGRPKKPTSVAAVFEQELDTSITIAGRPTSGRQAIIDAALAKALAGNIFAIGRIVKFLDNYGLLSAASAEGGTGGIVRLPHGYDEATEEQRPNMYVQAVRDAQKKHAASRAPWHSNSSLDMTAALNGGLARKSIINVDGVPTSMKNLDALMHILVRAAADGSGRAADLVVNLQKKIARVAQEQHERGGRGFLLVEEPCKTGEEWEAKFGAAAVARRGRATDSDNCSS